LIVGTFSVEQARYLAYHRKVVLGQHRPRQQRNLIGDKFSRLQTLIVSNRLPTRS
jgi:hypothetical protein